MAYYRSLLYLKEFRCVTETDEDGNDSPYFLVFVGNLSQGFFTDVVKLRMPAWDTAAYTGKLFTPNLMAHTRVDQNSTVVVTMLEEDWDPDVAGGALGILKLVLTTHFQKYSSWQLTPAQRGELMRGHMATSVKGMLANDEYLGTKHLPISVEVGDLPLLTFTGDLGKYNVRFKMVDTQA